VGRVGAAAAAPGRDPTGLVLPAMPPRVPFVALDRQHAPLRSELRDAFERVADRSSFILGEEVEGFEAEFAAYCGATHCAGVGSGTAALTLALSAAGIGPGDEVVVPAHTFIASALGVVHAGATPVFCEVEDGTGLIDPDAAAAAVSDRTAAVLAVHLYGQMADMDALAATCDRHGLALIENAAQAHGASWRGRRAGSLGTAAAFSFYPSKNLGALGDGGAVVTADAALAERVRALRHLGQRHKGEHALTGWNERLDGLQAALLRVKLPHLDGWNEARRAHAARYRDLLQGSLRLLEERPESPCVYHLFPVRSTDRDGLAAALADAGVDTGIHYSPACHRQPPFALDLGPDPFPVASAWAAEELSLPMFEHLSDTEIQHVAGATTRQTVLHGREPGVTQP
jgi:dTDP-3-amino-3,4,6-trideoxy-alpha-D-glucose transaminase